MQTNRMKIHFIHIIWLALLSCQSNNTDMSVETGASHSINDSTLHIHADQQQMAGILLGLPEKRPVSETIACVGMVETPPQSKASVYAPIQGYVRQVHGYPGTAVKKGDLLAIIEHPDIISQQQQYLDAQAQLTYWISEQNRLQQLVQGEVAAKKQLEQANAQLATAKATAEALEAHLLFMGINPDKVQEGIVSAVRLTAPISGYITEINTHLGALASTEASLYELVDDSHLHLELGVYTRDIARIAPGQQVTFSLPNASEVYHGTVQLIGKQVDMETKTVQVHVHFDEEEITLTPGTYVNAQIMLQTDTLNTLPETAFVRQGEQQYVFVQDGENFVRIPVEAGIANNGYMSVQIPAIWRNKNIVLKGAYYLQGMASASEDDGGH